MARRAKPRKLEVMLKEDSISNISSDSESELSEAETTRDSLPKKKRATYSGASAESNGLADDSEAGPVLERPKTWRSKRGNDPDVLSEESDTEDLDAAKLFTLLYTICDNVKKNTRCLKQLQQAQATRQSRCV